MIKFLLTFIPIFNSLPILWNKSLALFDSKELAILPQRNYVISSRATSIFFQLNSTAINYNGDQYKRLSISNTTLSLLFGHAVISQLYHWNQSSSAYYFKQKVGSFSSDRPALSGNGLVACVPQNNQIFFYNRSSQDQTFSQFVKNQRTGTDYAISNTDGNTIVATNIQNQRIFGIYKRNGDLYTFSSHASSSSSVINQMRFDNSQQNIFIAGDLSLQVINHVNLSISLIASTSIQYILTVNSNQVYFCSINRQYLYKWNSTNMIAQQISQQETPVDCNSLQITQFIIGYGNGDGIYLYCRYRKLSTGQCVKDCPLGFRQDGIESCVACTSNCQKCDQLKCTQCDNNSFYSLGACYLECPENYMEDRYTKLCNSLECEKLTGQQKQICYVIKDFKIQRIVIGFKNEGQLIIQYNSSSLLKRSQLQIQKLAFLKSNSRLLEQKQIKFTTRTTDNKFLITFQLPQKLSSYLSLDIVLKYNNTNYTVPIINITQVQIIQANYRITIPYWILSLFLITISILFSIFKIHYPILSTWQLPFLLIISNKNLTTTYYSVALGLSFTGLNFISPFTTQKLADNNFMRNQGVVVLLLLLIGIFYILLRNHDQIQRVLWGLLKVPIPSLIYYSLQQFICKQYCQQSNLKIGGIIVSILALMIIVLQLGLSIYRLIKYKIHKKNTIPVDQEIQQFNKNFKNSKFQINNQQFGQQQFQQNPTHQIQKKQQNSPQSQTDVLHQNINDSSHQLPISYYLVDILQIIIGIAFALIAFFNINLYFLLIIHAIWIPLLLCSFNYKELILFSMNQAMIICIVWNDAIGAVIVLQAITIIISSVILFFKVQQLEI